MEIAIIPEYLFKYFNLDFNKRYDYNILISNLLIIVLFLSLKNTLIPILNNIPHFCLIDKLIGMQCPFCGTTRGLCELSAGNLYSAYQLNRTSFLVAFFFVFQIPLRLISILKNINVATLSKNISNLTLLIIFINWISKLIFNI